ncbi:Uncharacterized protein B5E38_5012 [Bacillus cereus]|nr:Uncharacterized protein B5E38_5012 [Bacillus cereus]ARO65098.1 Uncharacterized protein B5E39_2727 [Bacillus cereus]
MRLSNTFRVTKIVKKTQAAFFKGLKVGDEFSLVFPLNGGYGNAPTIEIYQNGDYKGERYVSTIKGLIGYNLEVETVGVHISQEHFDSLEDSSLKLAKLEAYGVDNWSGYGIAMTDEEGIFE